MALHWYGPSGPEDRDALAASRDRDAGDRDRRSVDRDRAGRLRDEAARLRDTSAVEDEQLIRGLLLAGDRRDLGDRARRNRIEPDLEPSRPPATEASNDVAAELEESIWLMAADDRAEMREALIRLADLRRQEAGDRHLAAEDRRLAAADRAAAADDRAAAAAERDQAAIERAQSRDG